MKLFITFLFFLNTFSLLAQKPCESNITYNQFDFWIGEWEVYGKNNKIAGNSKITKILDNCVILEEWTSANENKGLVYAGKSFNSYNANTNQWQQNWIDNSGNSTEYLNGFFSNNVMQFTSRSFKNGNKTCIRRLSFFKLENGYVRQFGEITNDEGKTWNIEYDLEYRPKK